MSSKIKVDTIENVAGSGNVSLGSGHNLVVPGNITGQGTTTLTDDLTVDTNTLFVDASADKVGINNTTPGSYLTSDLVVGDTTGDNAITVVSGNANASGIFFQDTTGVSIVSGVRYQHDINKMGLWTNGGERIGIDSGGRVTTPSQPSFAVYGVNNNTGFNMIDGTSTKLANWSNTLHNTGSHFNTTTGVFTAPVAGKYFFYLQVMFRMNTSTYISDLLFSFEKNGANYITTDIGYNDDGNGDGWNTETLSSIISLNANDTVTGHYFLASTSHSTGATTNWSIYNGTYTQFHGHLLG